MANTALSESFDSGIGAIGNGWNVDTSIPGQVTLAGSAALMEWAVGREAGHGYGTYTITAKVDGSQPGPGIVLWPGDNSWPGQEIDMVEVTPDGSGRQYGTVHWNNGGYDSYIAEIFDGVGGGVFHDYQMVWEPGRLTFRVDGAEKAVITDHVPTDFDHGGMNNTIGFLNTNPNTSITVTHVDFAPLGGAAPAAAPASAPAPAAAVDWNAIAAEMTALHDATDSWNPDAAASAPQASAPAVTVEAAVDWNAIAAEVTALYDATGKWLVGEVASVAEASSALLQGNVVDWNALAEQVSAHYDATGAWFF